MTLVSLAGCGKPPRPEMAPVSGVVLYQSKPIEGALVTFRNDKSPRVAAGTTDRDGKFRLTTFENNDGAIIGEHVDTISKSQANPELAGASVENPSAAYGKGMAAAASGNLDQIRKLELPAKYADPATSGLKQTVQKGSNNFEFKLD